MVHVFFTLPTKTDKVKIRLPTFNKTSFNYFKNNHFENALVYISRM